MSIDPFDWLAGNGQRRADDERACIHGALTNGWCERCARLDILDGELERAVEWITQQMWAAAESSLRVAWQQKAKLG
jgi:hypothetical protein